MLRVRRASLPVVSVGNLRLGGSGKTPLVEWLARELQRRGRRPAIVSRGYGRRTPPGQLVEVSDGNRVLVTAADGGDEPTMLARALPGVPVVVCSERWRACEYIAARRSADCIILDDGFQHLRLARDFDLVLVDPGVRSAAVFPAGDLREPVDALARAHAFLLPADAGGADAFAAWLASAFPGRPVYRFRALPDTLEPLSGRAVLPPEALRGRRVLAFAGIAAPVRFFTSLRALGADVVDVPLEDHVRYDPELVAELTARARDAGCEALVTSAKDAVKLTELPVDAALPIHVLRQRIDVEDGETLVQHVIAAIGAGASRP
jgi:tetraacyldisaccharide 4'-kinase